MLVASLVAALIAICAAVEALDRISRFYNRRCEDSFGVKLLSEKAVAGWAGLMALVCFGDTSRRYAAAAGRDELDGALLMGVGARRACLAHLKSPAHKHRLWRRRDGAAASLRTCSLPVRLSHGDRLGCARGLGVLRAGRR